MANKKRLIDANQIAYHRSGFPEKDGQNGRLDWAFREDTEKLPTIDAVEVVRCKDCKHMEITPDNLRWCNAWNSINGMGDDGYCNYGERRCE